MAIDKVKLPDNSTQDVHAIRIKETTLEDEEFTYQATPVHDIADAYRIDRIKGRTLAFNQMIQVTDYPTITDGGITRTNNGDGSITLSGTATGLSYPSHDYYLINGHVYLYRMCPPDGASGKYLAELSGVGADYGGGIIGKFNETSGNRFCRLYIYENVVLNNVVIYPHIIDLTLMFGAGNEPSTVAEFEAMYPLPYYGYNEGELISVAAEGIETVGFNLFDEGIMSGWNYITRNADGWSGALNRFYLHRCFENTFSYTGRVFINMNYSLDEGTGFLTAYYVDGTYNDYRLDPATRATVGYETPAGKVIDHIEFSYTKNGTLTIHSLCVNLSDASRNGQYEPHWSKVLPLGLDAIKVKSHNIWDEEWENGYYAFNDGGRPVSSPDYVRSKDNDPIRVFPSTEYCFTVKNQHSINDHIGNVLFYDKAGNYIGTTGLYMPGLSHTFTTPAGAYYMRFYLTDYYGKAYANDICINLSDPAFNGQYELHGVITVNGLASAGDVHDEIVGGKLIKRVGRVDLGTLNWSSAGNDGVFFTTGINTVVRDASIAANLISSKLEAVGYFDIVVPNKIGAAIDSGNCYVRAAGDTNYNNDPTAFKTAMSGVYLYYELATPVEYDLASPVPLSGRIDGNGTMRVISDNIVAPFNGDITYGCNPGQIAADSNALMGYVNSVFDLRYYETSEPSGGMLPNREYQLGTLSGNTTFTLAAGTSGVTNHYFWSFDTGSTAPTITWPSGITSWYGGSAPTINASKHYEVSVLNGVAVVMEV